MTVRRTACVLLAVGCAALASAPAAGAEAPAAPPPPAASAQKMAMKVTIKRFVADRSGISALGTASASVAGQGTRRQVIMAVSRTSRCTVLSLNLQNLQLQLLGLNLVASPINLHITGNSHRTLGALFCRLAGGLKLSKLAGARAAARTLNSRLARRPMRALAVSANLYPSTAQAAQATGGPTCDVLDLVIGPLNLDLLGLVVDLYGPTAAQPVEVHVTANPAGGILGGVFCKLASGQAVPL